MIDSSKLNDLIVRIQDHDIGSFDEMYELTKATLFHFIFAIVKDNGLAEDVLQETYIKALESIDSYKRNTNSLAWLITIARNISINLFNKRKREIQIDVNENPNLFPGYSIKFEDQTIFNNMKKCLNDSEIEIVILHVLDEYTHKEIANMLHIPLGTVTWKYNNAIKKLQKELGDKYE